MEVNMDTKGQNTRTPEERHADTIQPLIPYVLCLLLGSAIGRLFAYIYGERPTQRVVKMWRGGEDEKALLAFLSPTLRRRVRNRIKAQLRLQLRESDPSHRFRKMFCETWDAIRALAKDNDPDFPPASDLDRRLKAADLSHIGKYSQIETRVERRAKETTSESNEWARVFPPVDPVVDPRLRRELLEEVGGYGGYSWELATTIAESQLNLRSLDGQLTDRQASRFLSNLTHLPAQQLRKVESSRVPDIVRDMILELIKLLTDEQKAREFTGRLLGKVLINRHLDQPYSKAKKIDLDKPVGDDLTLADTIWCSQADDQFSLIDDAIFLRRYLPEHLPPAEWEASDLFLRAGEREITPEQLCEEENKNFETVQRNFERAVKRLKSQGAET